MKSDSLLVGAHSVAALQVNQGKPKPVQDFLVQEGALQIVLNGEPYSVTMRTPGEDSLLALGLLFSEGRLRDYAEVESVIESPALLDSADAFVDVEESGDARVDTGVNGDMRIDADTVSVHLNRGLTDEKPVVKRRLISTAACGVCGVTSAEDMAATISVKAGSRKFDVNLLSDLESKMRNAQNLFSQTGGSHAAAAFGIEGKVLVLKEDVGRHNAVDKVIGYLLTHGSMRDAAILFISGRVSYEIVSKAARAGIPFLLAVSAPSTLAVRLCREAGITLLAFCRGGKCTVYSHPESVKFGVET